MRHHGLVLKDCTKVFSCLHDYVWCVSIAIAFNPGSSCYEQAE